jgi:energy-coupling factor transporter ATP-binding protein EcfA2
MQLLKKVAENNLVIVVSHDPEEAEVYADRIIRIKDGKLAEDTGSKESVFEARPFEMVHKHLGFIASLKYGLNSIGKNKGQMLITTFVISISLLFANLLGSYLTFLFNPNPILTEMLDKEGLAYIMNDLQGYLSVSSSRDILIAMYIILVAVSYVFLSMSITRRRKQIGIFKALGGNTHDILRIFVWEGIVLALFTWLF